MLTGSWQRGAARPLAAAVLLLVLLPWPAMAAQLMLAPGDINQEDITNNAVLVWRAMRCFHFSLTDNPGVNHFELPANPGLLDRLVANAARPRSECS